MPRKKAYKHEHHHIEILTGMVLILVLALIIESFFLLRSHVGYRRGYSHNKCSYKACAEATKEVGWTSWTATTTTSRGLDLSYRYPMDFSANYISKTEWPPVLTASKENFSCAPGGVETTSEGTTERKVISGHLYCLNKSSEGTAGSVYTKYIYSFPYTSSEGTYSMNFSFALQFVQCDTYDEPNRSACKNERTNLNLYRLIDQMAQTVKIR
jgi:hypothetical protein